MDHRDQVLPSPETSSYSNPKFSGPKQVEIPLKRVSVQKTPVPCRIRYNTGTAVQDKRFHVSVGGALTMPEVARQFFRTAVIGLMLVVLVCPPDLVAGRVDSWLSPNISTRATTLEIENSVFNSVLHGGTQNLSRGSLSTGTGDINVIATDLQKVVSLAFNNQNSRHHRERRRLGAYAGVVSHLGDS